MTPIFLIARIGREDNSVAQNWIINQNIFSSEVHIFDLHHNSHKYFLFATNLRILMKDNKSPNILHHIIGLLNLKFLFLTSLSNQGFMQLFDNFSSSPYPHVQDYGSGKDKDQ